MISDSSLQGWCDSRTWSWRDRACCSMSSLKLTSWKGYLSPSSFKHMERDTDNLFCPLHTFKYACVSAHVSCSLAGFFFFFHKVKEQEHPSSLMAKWLCITWWLIACDIRGGGILTNCISDSLWKPGGAGAIISLCGHLGVGADPLQRAGTITGRDVELSNLGWSF